MTKQVTVGQVFDRVWQEKWVKLCRSIGKGWYRTPTLLGGAPLFNMCFYLNKSRGFWFIYTTDYIMYMGVTLSQLV